MSVVTECQEKGTERESAKNQDGTVVKISKWHGARRVPTASMVAEARAAWPNPWGDMKQAILRGSCRWFSLFMFARISITYGWVKDIGDSSALAAMIGLSRRKSTSKLG
jgi:hypothetical protein